MSLDNEPLNPADVMRVTDLFDSPTFFKDGPSSSDIEQGCLGDCWFLSALAAIATVPNLLERICVGCDELVGVYGFVFFRDGYWTDVIIDEYVFVSSPSPHIDLPASSLVFVTNPKFAELTDEGKKLYHYNQELYNNTARKGRKSLYFARSIDEGETWVPLIEKAYAKLHGDYAALSGGKAMEAIEDLTGGVCSEIPIIVRPSELHTSLCLIFLQDILDPQRLWTELLTEPLQHHLFGCFLPNINSARSKNDNITVHGLVPDHAYSVLKTKEYKGKKFLVIRNPWGKGEWTGPWSDGSKEWTAEWLPLLKILDHQPGNDGVFIMECETRSSVRISESDWRSHKMATS